MPALTGLCDGLMLVTVPGILESLDICSLSSVLAIDNDFPTLCDIRNSESIPKLSSDF